MSVVGLFNGVEELDEEEDWLSVFVIVLTGFWVELKVVVEVEVDPPFMTIEAEPPTPNELAWFEVKTTQLIPLTIYPI